MKEEAIDHILPFWMDLKDDLNGGYYGELDHKLNLNKKGHKGGIASARLLWSFSAAYNVFKDPKYLEHANHIYEFLVNHVIDLDQGGLYWMLDYKGQVIDDRKHVYAQSFGIYALAEYYEASSNTEAFQLAFDLYELIETKGYKKDIGIYGEEYTRLWQPKENDMLSENGVVASITTNTLLHILEAYTRLHQVSKSKEVLKSLRFLVDIFKDKIWNKSSDHMHIFFDSQWKGIVDLKSYGHDIEATWLYDLALKEIGQSQNKEYSDFVTCIGKQISLVAIDEDGSIYNEDEDGKVDKTRVWWCQVEGIVGYINLYHRTGQVEYREIAENLWKYTSEYLIDHRVHGEWHYSRLENGDICEGYIVEPWKTPYHNLRACLEVIKRLSIAKI